MRKLMGFVLLFCLVLASGKALLAQGRKVETHTSPDQKYSYLTVEGDPTQTRIYTLPNGLTVFLSVNKAEPRIQTNIGVRAGSKNDPADATGLAHYLEHILFKGTDRFGSLDYAKEKPLLDKIEALYETYRATKGDAERAAIYHQIDSISGEAAKFAIANEYDKMLSAIGAKGTNAYTSFEQTVYVNDVPSNQLEKWLTIEAERFRNPVVRLFHTELEAVYEEKNRTLDNDGRKASEALLSAVFPTHNYGQQTTIGTIEHLKNPSITKIKQYFAANYVPNNMAICLSGDFDPDKAIVLIDKKFGTFQRKEIFPYAPAPEQPLQGPIVREVSGPDAEFVQIAFRFPGVRTRDARILTLLDAVLSNAKAGLMDLNLNKKQMVLNAGSYVMGLSDYSVLVLNGKPKAGQSLDEVANLMLEQLEQVKKGNFDESLLAAILTEIEINEMRNFESNQGRVGSLTDAFTSYTNWADYLSRVDEMRQIKKEEVVKFANQNLGKNYVIVYKRNAPRTEGVKVVKPPITPVAVNREAKSPFLQEVVSKSVQPIEAKFLDYKTDIQTKSLKNGSFFHYVPNTENQLFTLIYEYELGSKNDKRLDVALGLLNYLGTGSRSAEEVSKAFYQIGSNFSTGVSQDRVEITLTGLGKNLGETIKLFQTLLKDCMGNEGVLDSYVGRILKARTDAKLSKGTILNGALLNYGMYGDKNPFNNVLSNQELQALKLDDLLALLRSLPNYKHRVYFYGPNKLEEVISNVETQESQMALSSAPAGTNFSFADTKENTVYFLDYDMVQAEVMWLNHGLTFADAQMPDILIFNEYFGGGMSSLVFQEIRESKALAYSTWARYAIPRIGGDPSWMTAYVGTQADKIHESIAAMQTLLDSIPVSENRFKSAKEALENQYRTTRIIRTAILQNYKTALRFGRDHDIRKDIMAKIPTLTMKNVKDFHAKNVAGRPYTLIVLGSKNKIDLQSLEKYGRVVELNLEQVFGY